VPPLVRYFFGYLSL